MGKYETMNRLKQLRYDPIEPLLSSGYDNIIYFTRRDLLEERAGDVQELWNLKKAQNILSRQKPDGGWEYPNPRERIRKKEHYDLLETFRQLGFLVECFGFDRRHPAIGRAKDFVFQYQAEEGDIRGVYWNQYSPNYSAGFLELLIKAGYGDDWRVLRGLEWLLSVRQDDGGWVIPMRTVRNKLMSEKNYGPPLQPDRSRPFSYMVTGVVIRAFAHHRDYENRREIREAAELVLSRLFKKDFYPDRGAAEYWTRFSFPFWYTDLIAVLDPIAHLGFKPDHPKISEGLAWFVNNQERDGTWHLKLLKGDKREQPFWMALNIGRLFKKFYG
jgi:hypothetical protein